MKMKDRSIIVVGGDSGVYVGYAENGVRGVTADGRVILTGARHLRRYYVAGRQGDRVLRDLAVCGLDPDSPSVSQPVAGETLLRGVRRAISVCPDVAASFGIPS